MDEADLLIQKAESKPQAAKVLFENEFYADAVSGAYYSMYYSARALLRTKDLSPKPHKGLSKFGLELVKKGEIETYYARGISTAEERRERADYDIYYKPPKEDVDVIIQDAEKFLERVQRALKEVGR